MDKSVPPPPVSKKSLLQSAAVSRRNRNVFSSETYSGLEISELTQEENYLVGKIGNTE
jgi:hypothetical protein